MKRRAWFIALALAGMCAAALLLYGGVVRPRFTSPERYPVRGVDVSAYQGEVDWPTLAAQGIDFAFIKATEGSGSVDERFAENWAGVADTKLRTGAYHFFSFDSPGSSTQAENFIRTVRPREGLLPPVVDVEFYGAYKRRPPEDADAVRTELRTLIEALEAEYGQAPVLYATGRAYNLLLAGEFPRCDIWIRDVYFQPRLSDGRAWTFWQYSDRGRLDGYAGEEKYIDLNVFHGSAEEFTAYAD